MPETEIANREVARPEIVVKNVGIQLHLHLQTRPNQTSLQVDIIDAAVEAFHNLQEITEGVKIVIRFQIMKHNNFNVLLCT